MKNNITIRHFIPLIGPYLLACKKLNLKDEENIYSFSDFKNNEQHIILNDKNKRIHLLDELKKEINSSSEMELFKKYVKDNNIKSTNILTGVPPCAGLSLLNSCSKGNKKRDANSIQNDWIYASVKFYLATNTDVLVIENAPALSTLKAKQILKNINNIIKSNNYERTIQLVRTTTLNHGLPQNRVRTFLFIHKNKSILLKNKKHNKVDIKYFLDNLNLEENDEINITIENNYIKEWNKILNKNHSLLKEKFNKISKDYDNKIITTWDLLLKSNINIEDIIKESDILLKEYEKIKNKLKCNKGFWDSSPLFVKGRINAVISKNCFRILYPEKFNRYLTMRELMCLMGMPKNFKMHQPSKNSNHICQNIPVDTAADSILWAIELLNNENQIKVDENKIIVQNNMKSNLEKDIYFIELV